MTFQFKSNNEYKTKLTVVRKNRFVVVVDVTVVHSYTLHIKWENRLMMLFV